MALTINTREELLAVRSGTLMIDRDGYPMTRTHEGEFALWAADEERWKFYSTDEIDGTLVHMGESHFFPITCPDEELPTEKKRKRSFLCFLGLHTFVAQSTPHTYLCVRCQFQISDI